MLAEDVGSGLCTIWLTKRTLITGGKWNADSPWHKVAMQLLKLWPCLSHMTIYSLGTGREGIVLDLTWVMYFAAGELARCCDRDLTEPYGGRWEFTKEKDDEMSGAVGDAVLVTKVLIIADKAVLDLASIFLNFISFHCPPPQHSRPR